MPELQPWLVVVAALAVVWAYRRHQKSVAERPMIANGWRLAVVRWLRIQPPSAELERRIEALEKAIAEEGLKVAEAAHLHDIRLRQIEHVLGPILHDVFPAPKRD